MRTEVFSQDGVKKAKRQLVKREQERILALASTLPKGRPDYSFYGPSVPDATTVFGLTVGARKAARSYSLNDSFSNYAGNPETKPILQVMHWMHELLGSKVAELPPPVTGVFPR